MNNCHLMFSINWVHSLSPCIRYKTDNSCSSSGAALYGLAIQEISKCILESYFAACLYLDADDAKKKFVWTVTCLSYNSHTHLFYDNQNIEGWWGCSFVLISCQNLHIKYSWEECISQWPWLETLFCFVPTIKNLVPMIAARQEMFDRIATGQMQFEWKVSRFKSFFPDSPTPFRTDPVAIFITKFVHDWFHMAPDVGYNSVRILSPGLFNCTEYLKCWPFGRTRSFAW